MKILIWIMSLVAIGLALAILLAGPGTRFGVWEYSTGLRIIREAAMPTLIAAIVSAFGFVLALFTARGIAMLPLIAAISAAIAAYVPVGMKAAFEANPFIHDITTDFESPPPIVAAADKKRVNPPEYLGDEMAPRSELTVSAAQQDAFPDITTIETSMTVEAAARLSREVIAEMGMKLLSDGPVEDGWLVEAADTSFWFGFIDDFVVRVQPAGEGARVDIRSKSRVGGSDLGANAKRVRSFMERFKEASA